MTFRLRRMVSGDIPVTLALRVTTRENRVTAEEMRDVYGVTPESVAAGMAGSMAGWVCEDAGLLGFAMGDGASGEMLVVAVRPESEGQGVGGALLKAVQDWLFAQGHDRLWLLANPDPDVRASGFYARYGWRPSGETRGEDIVLELLRP